MPDTRSMVNPMDAAGCPRWSQYTCLKQDLYRYFYPSDDAPEMGLARKAWTFVNTQGCWATTVYRFRRYVLVECRTPVVRQLLDLSGKFMHKLVEMTTGIHIRPEIDIGPGLYIGHFGCIFLGGNTRMGMYCNISQENTLGYAGRGDKRGLPQVGDFVYIGPGAKLIGPITVGDHAAIGANAVVTKDVPAGAVAAGVPAKVISMAGSHDFVTFCRRKSLLNTGAQTDGQG